MCSCGTCKACRLMAHIKAHQKEAADRNQPCIHLGEVIDRVGSNCIYRWVRACQTHEKCTIMQCKACPDYEASEA